MGRLSEERKEVLLRRYGSISAAAGPGGMGPGGPGRRRPGGFGGPRPGPGGPPGAIDGGKPQNTLATINRLLAYIGRDRLKVLFVFACVLVSSLTNMAGSYILRPVINNLVAVDRSAEEKITSLVIGLLVMAGIYLAGVVCSYLQQRMMVGVSQNVLVKIREDLFRKVQKLPLEYHDTHTHGDLMSRFTNDLDAVGEMRNQTMVRVFSGVLMLIGTVALMFIINWLLAIVTIITVPLFVYVGGMIGQQSRKYFASQQQALGAVNGYIEETVALPEGNQSILPRRDSD